jgi:hypothetical protein
MAGVFYECVERGVHRAVWRRGGVGLCGEGVWVVCRLFVCVGVWRVVCGVCGVRDRPVDSPALLVLRHDFLFSLYRQLIIASDGQCIGTAERSWIARQAMDGPRRVLA